MRRTRKMTFGALAAAALGAVAGLAATAGGGSKATGPGAPAQQRVAFAGPASGQVGQAIALRLRRDGADAELTVEICDSPPAMEWRCRPEVLAEGRESARPELTLDAPGRWLVELRNGGRTARRAVDVTPPGGRLSVLATGDSMIQTVDAYLARALGARGDVESDARISTGLTSPEVFDWPAHAAEQARALRPGVTVVYLGANDGFPVRAPSGALAECCGEAWIVEYARRVEAMMRSYVRGGAGRVLWLTLPAPRDGHFVEVYRPVNEAVRRAARTVSGAVAVPIDELLAPGYRFQATVSRRGREIEVRQDDGIHLSAQGAEIVAEEVVAAMRAKRVLAPPARRRGAPPARASR